MGTGWGGEGPNNNNFFRISRSCLSSNFDNFPDFAKLFKFELGQLLKLFKVNFRQTSEFVILGGVSPPRTLLVFLGRTVM